MGWAEGKGWLQRRSVSARSDESFEDPSLKAFMSYSGPVRKIFRKDGSLFVQVGEFCYTLPLIRRRSLERGGARLDAVRFQGVSEGPCAESLHREID